MNQVISLAEAELVNIIREYTKLFDDLFDEAYHWWRLLREEKFHDPLLRRAAMRSTFAFVEGVVYSLKQLLLPLEKINPHLTLAEIVLLREEKYDLDDRGIPKPNLVTLELKKNLLFTIGCFAKFMKVEMPLNKKNNEWILFLNAVKIRNRLMHPKKPHDLNISDEEIEMVNKAFNWFYNGLIRCWGGRHPTSKKGSNL